VCTGNGGGREPVSPGAQLVPRFLGRFDQLTKADRQSFEPDLILVTEVKVDCRLRDAEAGRHVISEGWRKARSLNICTAARSTAERLASRIERFCLALGKGNCDSSMVASTLT
jgi:hypothetical protein